MASSTSSTQTNQKPGTSDVKIDNFSRNLRVALTEKELNEKGNRAAHLLSERDQKEEEARAAQKHAKAQIAEVEAELRRVSGEIRDGATYREVACQRVHNYRLGVIQELRTDTKEVIAERAMTDRERQLDLTLDQPKDGKTNGAHANGEGHALNGEASNDVSGEEDESASDDEYEPEPPLATEKPRRPRKSRRKA